MHMRLLFTVAGDMSTFSIIRWEDVDNIYGGLFTTKLKSVIELLSVKISLSRTVTLNLSRCAASQIICGLMGLSSHGLDSQKSNIMSDLKVVFFLNFQQN